MPPLASRQALSAASALERPGPSQSDGDQKIVDFGVARVLGQGFREIPEVAVEIDIVLGHPANMGEPVRVDGVRHHHATDFGRASMTPSLMRPIWQPEPQKPSLPCVPEMTMSRASASMSPNRATSVASSSPSAPLAFGLT